MALIGRNSNPEQAYFCIRDQPSDSRKVLLAFHHATFGKMTISVRYKDGRWIGATTRQDMTMYVVDDAIWTEMEKPQ